MRLIGRRYRCAHNGQHPYLLSIRPDGHEMTLTLQMKHRKQNKPAPPTHPSALAVPSYHSILVKHGLIEKTLSISDAYEVFLKVGADPEVQKLLSLAKIENAFEM